MVGAWHLLSAILSISYFPSSHTLSTTCSSSEITTCTGTSLHGLQCGYQLCHGTLLFWIWCSICSFSLCFLLLYLCNALTLSYTYFPRGITSLAAGLSCALQWAHLISLEQAGSITGSPSLSLERSLSSLGTCIQQKCLFKSQTEKECSSNHWVKLRKSSVERGKVKDNQHWLSKVFPK